MDRIRTFLLFTSVVACGAAAFASDAPAKFAAGVSGATTTGEVAADVRVVRGLVYAQPDGVEMKLDLHLPAEPGAGAPRPLLVWIHGGGWQEGGRGFCPLAPLAKEGYAVASISYRFTQQAKFPAQLHDAKAAIRWLRAHAADYGFDPARIGACGESAGGLLAALLGTSGDVAEVEGAGGTPGVSSRVQAVAALCPPTDVTLEDADQALVPELLKSADPKEVARGKTIRSRGAILEAALGGPLAEHRELARLMSPVTYVSADDAPFFFVHGDRDFLVPLAQSELMVAALQRAGVVATLEIVPGAGHGFGRPKPPLMAKIKAFFDAQL